ncbi:MAG: phosphatase PAP2 family protein [Lachnospiraceae bacterium]|nr:phosphatase PAP2 family protein [Lachnospiraceae bacterium]
MTDFIQALDWSILHGIHNKLQCAFLDFLMPKITLLGDGGAVWLLSASGLILSKKYRKYGFVMLGALAVGVLIGNLWLKPFIARSRPCWLEDAALLIKNPSDYSFPSGHTLSSVIGAFVLTAANRRFGYFAIPTAALIAFSRLYLYVHFPSDVLASVILGVCTGAAAAGLCKRLEKGMRAKDAKNPA